MFKTLITAADLAAHIDDPNWIVVDCRHDLQFNAAMVFAIIALTLLLSLLIRRIREYFARRRGA